ncbi:hypothetical protein VZT92_001288 [Zoarces viviparus]|uniref:Uncharacterized protein n=1 Tax=Zoarces viviparus TaxID=48416 RepID=A0AAW1G390_ZOAVI
MELKRTERQTYVSRTDLCTTGRGLCDSSALTDASGSKVSASFTCFLMGISDRVSSQSVLERDGESLRLRWKKKKGGQERGEGRRSPKRRRKLPSADPD